MNNQHKNQQKNNPSNNQEESKQKKDNGQVQQQSPANSEGGQQKSFVSLPKGGGAIKGIGEKFQANPITGTGSFSVPIAMSPGRNEFTPQLGLSYDSGSGNSPYGLGWSIGLPSISRKTDKSIPRYLDITSLPVSPISGENENGVESDTFILSGAEDLVPKLNADETWDCRTENGYNIFCYRPRVEGLFAKIERWYNITSKHTHWQATTKDNITSVYGYSPEACIIHPSDPTKIFQWLIEKTYDHKGNLIQYEHKAENNVNIPAECYEKNRSTYTNKYLKKVKYGNAAMYASPFGEYTADWHFQLVLDYGEHTNNLITENTGWSCRQDPFSSYKQGFEVRTYRLCKRILMFHKFSALGANPVLVKATELTFNENPILTTLTSITHKGYLDENMASYPALEFTYSQAVLGNKLHSIDPLNLHNLPVGIDGNGYSWTDLYGEGISGILKQDRNAWYYKPNLGDKRYYDNNILEPTPVLGSMTQVGNIPSVGAGNQQLTDLDGNGQLDLLVTKPELSGYFSLSDNGTWENFRQFKQMPNINWNDPNLKMIDMNGDGHPDIVITEQNCFTIYPNKTKEGYQAAYKTFKPDDEEKGPAIVFADSTQSIFLADMNGDGSMDIVRIRNGSVCYWANMGYGHFSEKIAMKNCPYFDAPDLFNPIYIKLADIDGSGTTDIIYLGSDNLYWKNQAGNSWSSPLKISNFPAVNSMSTASVIDLFGNGTSCLVWSSILPADTAKIHYLELTSGIKPNLLIETNNNMGAHTKLQYAPSTKFYLRDKRQGKPWICKLSFPVHVLERTEIWDETTNSRYVTRYAYHHGYFDGFEREFRGFGMVEQWDTEQYDQYPEGNLFTLGENEQDEESNTPPVYSKTWFHTGFYTADNRISTQYQNEYFNLDIYACLLPDTQLPAGLTNKEIREACRAMKGSILRQEVYGLDGSTVSNIPYTVAEKAYTIRKIQAFGKNPHAVFHVLESETLTYNYERNANDPRIAHQLIIETDDFGNVLKAATLAYPHRGTLPANQNQQQTFYVKYDENAFINQNNSPVCYRIGLPLEQKSWQLFGLDSSEKLTSASINSFLENATEIAYYEEYNSGNKKKKILHTKAYYYNEAMNDKLNFGEAASHGLPYNSQSLAITLAMLEKMHQLNTYNTDQHYNSLQPNAADQESLLLANTYIEDNNTYWRASARVYCDPDQFYLPTIQYDAFENETSISYDAYKLMPLSVTDPLNDTIQVLNNYSLLKPYQITDPNGSKQTIGFDALGMVNALALSGVTSAEGDTIQNPTIRYTYNLFAWSQEQKPIWVHISAKKNHSDNNTPADSANCLHTYTYSNALGMELQTKVQAENGKAWHLNNGVPQQIDSNDRWVATGRTIYNNKQKVIKQYEPWFSTTYQYEGEAELTEYGVTPIMHYDTVGRLIRTDFPDGTYAKTTFDAWQQLIYDQNDTVADSHWYTVRNPQSDATDEEKRAAQLALAHNDTPQTIYLDVLGRPFLTIDNNGGTTRYAVLNQLNITGNVLTVTDAKNRQMTTNYYDMTGQLIYSCNIDSGRRWMLYDIAGKPLRLWDNRNNEMQYEYDALQRPTKTKLKENGNSSVLTVESIIYGTSTAGYLKGKPEFTYDQAGKTQINAFDFKGNPLSISKQFTQTYNASINWENSPALESETFSTIFTYDAMNRPLQQTKPDGTIETYTYNKAALLETIQARIKGAPDTTGFISNINYNEKGQRTEVYYGNNSRTEFIYDEKTFRLKQLRTTRNSESTALQDLNYTYDPVGNIVQQKDIVPKTVYFNNSVVEASGRYEYDAMYRITRAEGRELKALAMAGVDDFVNTFSVPNTDTQALQNYIQLFVYDELGNILSLNSQNQWTRNYIYETANNRMKKHDPNQTLDDYTYDAHGNITSMPHLSAMEWDYANRLRKTTCGTVDTYYCYDINGERTRKVSEKQGGIKEVRTYLGGNEIYRKYVSGDLNKERQTLHIDDDKKKVALIETLTVENGEEITTPTPIIRYQYDNHLGSACLELSSTAAIISYEEYHPFGTTSYRSGVSETEVSLKRYKYIGKERDEETGLYYYGARYYAAWLCRFVSVDPLQHKYPYYTPYQYAGNKPISYIDLDGLEELKKSPDETKEYEKTFIVEPPRNNKDNTTVANNKNEAVNEFQPITIDVINKQIDKYGSIFGIKDTKKAKEIASHYYSLFRNSNTETNNKNGTYRANIKPEDQEHQEPGECYNASKHMILINAGYGNLYYFPASDDKSIIWIATGEEKNREKNKKHHVYIDKTKSDLAIETLKENLKQGLPVILGVDYMDPAIVGKKPYNEGITDHWIVGVAMGKDKRGDYIQFYDVVGVFSQKQATDPENKLYYEGNGVWRGGPVNSKMYYSLTVVRPMLKKNKK